MAKKTGIGCTLGFGTTTTWTPDYISIGGPSISRDALETSHLGTTGGFKTFTPGDLSDGGEVTAEFYFEPEDLYPPINAVAENITITNNDTGAMTEVFSGFITGFENATRVLGDLMKATLTIKVAGVITVTA